MSINNKHLLTHLILTASLGSDMTTTPMFADVEPEAQKVPVLGSHSRYDLGQWCPLASSPGSRHLGTC